ncbi:hypothetical protein T492DRAFT_838795 [Pavlovales sp. CCMP2436]|nr:hypothetical protein T492DRAFT_838795 [Pavlovales sp. CCMP2436]
MSGGMLALSGLGGGGCLGGAWEALPWDFHENDEDMRWVVTCQHFRAWEALFRDILQTFEYAMGGDMSALSGLGGSPEGSSEVAEAAKEAARIAEEEAATAKKIRKKCSAN